MKQRIGHIALVVREYDEAIDFFTNVLDFTLVEDTEQPDEEKRWVVVSPPNSDGANLVLSRARDVEQSKAIGNQTGGRVFLFLYTDNFQRDFQKMNSRGVEFVREPHDFPYGTVAVFKDLYGNLWDLIEPKNE